MSSQASNTKTCLICSNKMDMFSLNKNQTEFKENRKVCEIFCRVACRYLKFNCGGDGDIKAEQTITANADINQADDNNLLCVHCFPLAESFCEIYQNFKQLELIFHWRMREFVDLIQVQMEKGIDLDKAMECGSSEERNRGWMNFRKKFVTRGNQTFVANDIPKLQVRKIKVDTEKLQNRKITTDSNRNSNTVQKEIVFENMLDINSKTEINMEVLNYDCQFCGKSFEGLRNLHNHEEETHFNSGSPREIHKCPTCDKPYTSKKSLHVHMETHSGKIHRCPICDKEFSTVHTLARHRKSNSHLSAAFGSVARSTITNNGNTQQESNQKKICKKSSKAFCKMCGKLFASIQYLRIHKLIHSGDKSYKCAICGQKFRHTTALTVHGKTKHQGEDFRGPKKKSSFACSLCNKVFRELSHKVIHERSHSNVRPYKCKFCVRRYRLRARLEKHQKECSEFKRMNLQINQSTLDNSNVKLDISDNDLIDEGVTKLVKVDSYSNRLENEEILQAGDNFILPD